jgi:hypothetical protein
MVEPKAPIDQPVPSHQFPSKISRINWLHTAPRDAGVWALSLSKGEDPDSFPRMMC